MIRLICAALTAMMLLVSGTGFPQVLAENTGNENIDAAEMAVPEESAGEEAEETSAVFSMDSFEEKGLALFESDVRYPALKEGAADEDLRQKINDLILSDGKITDYVTRVSQLISGGSLTVRWKGAVMGNIFSFAVSAEGAVETLRPTFVWTGGNIDLETGEEATWEDLFTDPDHAKEIIAAYLEEDVLPDLSAHLLNSDLTNLPDLYRMTERGLILLYPIDSLSTLSDRAGDVLIPWAVLKDELKTGEGTIADRMGLQNYIGVNESTLEKLEAAVTNGEIPGIPVKLGDSVFALEEEYSLLTDPDVYSGGRLFSLEGGSFRGVFLLTDYLSESWDNSVVDGIRVDVGGVEGLIIGETTMDEWRSALGEPDTTVVFDADQAEAWRTLPGTRDYYNFGEHVLQLHADESGTLISVILTE